MTFNFLISAKRTVDWKPATLRGPRPSKQLPRSRVGRKFINTRNGGRRRERGQSNATTFPLAEASSDRDTSELRVASVYLSGTNNARSDDRRGRTAPLSCTADWYPWSHPTWGCDRNVVLVATVAPLSSPAHEIRRLTAAPISRETCWNCLQGVYTDTLSGRFVVHGGRYWAPVVYQN